MRSILAAMLLAAGCVAGDDISTGDEWADDETGGDVEVDPMPDLGPRGSDCLIDRDFSEMDVLALYDEAGLFDSPEDLEAFLGIRDDECNRGWSLDRVPNACIHGTCTPIAIGSTAYPCLTGSGGKVCNGACYHFQIKEPSSGQWYAKAICE
jgi:hypothetical protein